MPALDDARPWPATFECAPAAAVVVAVSAAEGADMLAVSAAAEPDLPAGRRSRLVEPEVTRKLPRALAVYAATIQADA